MKRLVATTMLVAMGLSALAQKDTRIMTDIKGLAATDTLQLQWGAINKSATPYIMKRGAVGDSAFSIPLNEPRLLVMSLKGATAKLEILASPGETISISGKAKKIEAAIKDDVQFRKIIVSGARYQPEYENKINAYQRHQDSIDATVYNEYKDVAKLIEKAKETNDEGAIAEMYQSLHGQSYIDRVMNTYEEREEYKKRTILDNKDTFFGPMLLLKLAGRLNKEHKPLYDAMSNVAKQSYYGREVKDEVDPPSILDNLAPIVAVQDTAGAEKILSFAQHEGDYLVLDFWASWCQPCHKEIPNLKRLYNKYHDKGLEIIGISADNSEEEWLDCIEEIEEPWTNYIDIKRQAISEYKVQYIPSIFIIDGNGKIIAEKLRGKDLSDFIDKLFEGR